VTPPERSQTFVHPTAPLAAAGDYWLDKLAPFRHGPRFLSSGLTPNTSPTAAAQASCRVADTTASIDVAGLAAFMLVVSRYNAGEPMVIASPSGEQGAPIFLACANLDQRERTAAFVARVSADLELSRRHEPSPVPILASRLGLDGADAEKRLLQLVYVFGDGQDAFVTDRAAMCLRVEASAQEVRLTLTATGTAYPPSLLPQLVAHFAGAVAWIAQNPDAPIGDFAMLSAAERRQVGTSFNDARMPLPSGLTLHGLVSAQAARTPSSIAVTHGDRSITYHSLDRQANFLAAMLRRDFRVQTGHCVGVMMERSEKTVVALHGVMKAGAAYVPINPRHPWETIRYMIENAGISVLIVDSESIATAASFAGELIVIDVELSGSPEAAEAPVTGVTGEDLAYVIYTSGSTGQPKGVAVEHRAIVNTVLWRNAFYDIGPSDINLQIPSFAFDSSVVDIFCVLTVGGMLVIPEESMRLDARRLLALSAKRGITSCIVTPSYYKLLVGELAGAVPSLRWVTLAGESATPQLVAAHFEKLPGVGLYNEYGPTESAVCSTACRLKKPEATVTIGKPIWNVNVVILDGDGRLVPIGVPGEIYLGGSGLARGYLNQPALTAERFVPSPVPDVCAGLLYKTGDRACWRPDGDLEFLGRLDSQVKIRGFRIELDEVEQAVRRHPRVQSAAVICKEDAGGAKYLAAYVEGDPAPTQHQLRAHLAQQVPHYMIPDAITILPRLPLNLNGKIDRAALADIDDFRPQLATDTAALSPVQSNLVDLWADVLKRSPIALDDNFFAMGGNSLRVMELTSRIRGELSLGVELLDIYTYPTVRELADRLVGTE